MSVATDLHLLIPHLNNGEENAQHNGIWSCNLNLCSLFPKKYLLSEDFKHNKVSVIRMTHSPAVFEKPHVLLFDVVQYW